MTKYYKNFYVHKNQLLIREYDNGIENRFKRRIEPSYYFETDKESEYKTLLGKPLIKMDFLSQYDAKQWFDTYDTMKHKIFGFNHYEYTMINDMYPGDLSPVFNIKNLVGANIDIETQTEYGFPDIERANEEINLISISLSGGGHDGHITCFGYKDAIIKDKDATFVKCINEVDLLKKFVTHWASSNIDYVTGWNIDGFDLPYIVNRIELILGEDYMKMLSPWKIINKRTAKNSFGKDSLKIEIAGINIFDYLDLYRKFSGNQAESYKLGYITNLELGDTKVDYDCSFKDFYTNHWQTFVEYNIHDVRLVRKLEQKLGFISLGLTIAYKAKILPSDIFTTVRIWDVIISNALHSRNIMVPTFLNSGGDSGSYGGGYVKDPLIGYYEWLISVDATSLYPSIERTLNISMETILNPSQFIPITPDDIIDNTELYQKAKEKAHSLNACLAANGAMFKRDKQGIIPELNALYFNQRKSEKELGKKYEKASAHISTIFKNRSVNVDEINRNNTIETSLYEHSILNEMDNESLKTLFEFYTGKGIIQRNIEQAIKILINSLYGYLGSPYSRFYNKYIAEAITLTGQAIIRKSAEFVNEDLNKITGIEKDRIVGIDTDSNYIDLTDVVYSEKTQWYKKTTDEIVTLLDKFCDSRLEKTIAKGFEKLLMGDLNAFEQQIFMKREAIGSGIFVQKKRYTMYVYDNEKVRYAKPKLKITGLEAVRSTTPKYFREKMKEVYEMMYKVGQDEIYDVISDIRKEYFDMDISLIGKPTGVNNLEEYDNNSKELGVFKKGAPGHVKAAFTYNRLIDNMKIGSLHKHIGSGDKIKLYEVKVPNPYKNDKLAILDKIPPEFELDKYVDRETMLHDYFIKPISAVLQVRNWYAEPPVNLDDIFC